MIKIGIVLILILAPIAATYLLTWTIGAIEIVKEFRDAISSWIEDVEQTEEYYRQMEDDYENTKNPY